MKQYPSIQGMNKAPQLPCIAFYKYDGSNLRFEWNPKRGWWKQGTRTRLFDETDEQFGDAIHLFHSTWADRLDKRFRANKKLRGVKEITCFFEYFGPNSFAGQHEPEDPKQLVLIDVSVHKKGMLDASTFLDWFGDMEGCALVVYKGNLNTALKNAVVNNELYGDDHIPLNEGIVCKGGSGHRTWMAKIKTADWIRRLKERYPERWEEYL